MEDIFCKKKSKRTSKKINLYLFALFSFEILTVITIKTLEENAMSQELQKIHTSDSRVVLFYSSQ